APLDRLEIAADGARARDGEGQRPRMRDAHRPGAVHLGPSVGPAADARRRAEQPPYHVLGSRRAWRSVLAIEDRGDREAADQLLEPALEIRTEQRGNGGRAGWNAANHGEPEPLPALDLGSASVAQCDVVLEPIRSAFSLARV